MGAHVCTSMPSSCAAGVKARASWVVDKHSVDRAMSQTPERWLSFLLPRVDMQTPPPPFVGKVSFLQCLLWQLCWQAGGCSYLSSFLGYPSMPRLLNIFQSWPCLSWELYDPRYIAVMAILVNLAIWNRGHTCDLDLKAERQHAFILHLEVEQ